jgi:hypothetical protein
MERGRCLEPTASMTTRLERPASLSSQLVGHGPSSRVVQELEGLIRNVSFGRVQGLEELGARGIAVNVELDGVTAVALDPLRVSKSA